MTFSILTVERFHRRYLPVTESGCWLWESGLDKDGYGQFAPEGQHFRAHRFSYEAFVGPIPGGALVLHRCDIPACVNPAHLFLGSQADNLEDQRIKGRTPGKPPTKTHCVNGHELTPSNVVWRLPKGYKTLQRYCRQCNIDKAAARREAMKT